MITIERLSAIDDPAMRRDLLELLADAVEGGASVGFTLPFERDVGVSYWQDVSCSLVSGTHHLLVARNAKGEMVGAVQLIRSTRQNGRHRAEMQKLIVRKGYRRQGVARQLIAAAEDLAKARGIRLIVLDTRAGDAAEALYQTLGYTRSGVVPDYTSDGHGHYAATAFYYRLLAA
jgi:ribosomal protein S18 acetylase RimI-like enzyme